MQAYRLTSVHLHPHFYLYISREALVHTIHTNDKHIHMFIRTVYLAGNKDYVRVDRSTDSASRKGLEARG